MLSKPHVAILGKLHRGDVRLNASSVAITGGLCYSLKVADEQWSIRWWLVLPWLGIEKPNWEVESQTVKLVR